MRILIFGCTGSYNYGDELSHKTLKHLVKEKYPDAHITTVGCVRKILEREHYTSDKLISTANENEILDELKKCDFWIYGAGTIMPFTIELSEKMYNANNNFEIWGVSCGSDVVHDNHKEMIKKCRYISVRDNISKLRMQPYYDKNIEIISDPMLFHCAKNVIKNNYNGITISNHVEAWRNGWATDDMRKNLYTNIAEVMRKIGGRWIAIPASWNETDFDNDNACHIKLKEYYPDLEIFEPSNFDDVTNMLTGLNCYFTSRLHTGVVTAGSRIPTIWFGMQKCLDLCTTWNKEHGQMYAGFYTNLPVENFMNSYQYSISVSSNLNLI